MNPADDPKVESTTARPATAIVPAAGRSRRMGSAKPLLPFAGSTVLGRVLSALADGGAERVVVVVAPEAEEPSAGEVARRARAGGHQVAVNPDRDRGMLSSIRVGLEAAGVTAIAEGPVLVCPGDLPALSSTTVTAVLAALREPEVGLALPVVGGRRGHPLGIASRLVPEIAELDDRVGLRQLLLRHPDSLRTVETNDPGAVRDVDTPAEYRSLLSDTEAEAKPR